MKAKEGSFKAPKAMKKYLNKHLRRCLSKEEREVLLKEHPQPDLESAVPPKADKFIIDFLGKKFPKEQDTQLSKIQASVLASIRPLTSSWQTLVEEGLEEDLSMVVKASEVLSLVQCTLCLVGNASELISQTRHSKILEAIEPSWAKYGSDAFPSASGTLFGEDFQESLTKNMEKDGAISKALYVTRKGKKTAPSVPGSSTKEGQQNSQFFKGVLLPGTEADRARVFSRTASSTPIQGRESTASGGSPRASTSRSQSRSTTSRNSHHSKRNRHRKGPEHPREDSQRPMGVKSSHRE